MANRYGAIPLENWPPSAFNLPQPITSITPIPTGSITDLNNTSAMWDNKRKCWQVHHPLFQCLFEMRQPPQLASQFGPQERAIRAKINDGTFKIVRSVSARRGAAPGSQEQCNRLSIDRQNMTNDEVRACFLLAATDAVKVAIKEVQCDRCTTDFRTLERCVVDPASRERGCLGCVIANKPCTFSSYQSLYDDDDSLPPMPQKEAMAILCSASLTTAMGCVLKYWSMVKAIPAVKQAISSILADARPVQRETLEQFERSLFFITAAWHHTHLLARPPSAFPWSTTPRTFGSLVQDEDWEQCWYCPAELRTYISNAVTRTTHIHGTQVISIGTIPGIINNDQWPASFNRAQITFPQTPIEWATTLSQSTAFRILTSRTMECVIEQLHRAWHYFTTIQTRPLRDAMQGVHDTAGVSIIQCFQISFCRMMNHFHSSGLKFDLSDIGDDILPASHLNLFIPNPSEPTTWPSTDQPNLLDTNSNSQLIDEYLWSIQDNQLGPIAFSTAALGVRVGADRYMTARDDPELNDLWQGYSGLSPGEHASTYSVLDEPWLRPRKEAESTPGTPRGTSTGAQASPVSGRGSGRGSPAGLLSGRGSGRGSPLGPQSGRGSARGSPAGSPSGRGSGPAGQPSPASGRGGSRGSPAGSPLGRGSGPAARPSPPSGRGGGRGSPAGSPLGRGGGRGSPAGSPLGRGSGPAR